MEDTPKFETEVIRRVFDNAHGVFIEVGPDSEGLGLVEIRTVGKTSQEFFGELRLVLNPEMATELVGALHAVIMELKTKGK
jgi:hypothetical protein